MAYGMNFKHTHCAALFDFQKRKLFESSARNYKICSAFSQIFTFPKESRNK